MINMLYSFLGSAAVVGLLYFFYWLSSRHCSTKAYAECWWLPGWNCFRFVIRNMLSEGSLFCVKHRAWLKRIETDRPGSSVNTFVDTEIISGERILLPGGQDLPVLCFRFERHGDGLRFIHTDKLGTSINAYDISPEVDSFMLEYYLKIQSWFLFKHEIARIFRIPHYGKVKGSDERVDIFQKCLSHQQQEEHQLLLVFMTAEVITVAV